MAGEGVRERRMGERESMPMNKKEREREREADRQRTERILIRRDCNGRELQIGKTGANLEVGM